MGFTVPNGPDAASVDQSEPDALDYEALGTHRTGTISGCAVSAQGSPNMSVAVGSGKIVVAGEPVDVSSGTVAIQTSEANARFDLIVADFEGTKSAVKGVASGTNPVFPEVDLGQYVVLAAVYVGASASSITNAAIVDKRIVLPDTLLRSYASNATEILRAEAPVGAFRIQADGQTTWVDSVLKRLSANLMEWTTSLVLKAGEGAASVLTVKARDTSPSTQKAIDVQSSSGSTVASVSGTGVIAAANFITGDGSPEASEGGVIADKGSLYIDRLVPRNASLWIKEGESGTAEGWVPFRAFDPADDAVPVGTIAPFVGGIASIPAGWTGLVGQMISETADATKELAALVGGMYGSGVGVVGLPDFRGRIPMGSGGTVALTIGEVAGSAEVVLDIDNLPPHIHEVVDPGHAHPQSGRAVYGSPSGALHPSSDDNGTFAVLQESDTADRSSTTGISTSPTGLSDPVSILPPVVAITWMVKARSTGVQANADGSDGLWSVEDLDARYRPSVGALPPSAPFLGQIWIMTPENHSVLLHPDGWVPLFPPTGNLAVDAGNAVLDLDGFWLSSEGD